MDFVDRLADRVGSPIGVVTGTFLSLGAMAPDSLARPIVVCLIGVAGSICGSLIVDMIRRELDRAERERRRDDARDEIQELRREIEALRSRIETNETPSRGAAGGPSAASGALTPKERK